MAATTTAFQAHDPEKHQGVSSGPTLHGAGAGTEKNGLESGTLPRYDSDDVSSIHKGDFTHRKLKPRHIQLIGIGGTIGTALYVQIGRGLIQGGPGSLFLAFTIWCTFILGITNCTAEIVSYIPISSPFIRFAGRYVDEAFGVAAGYNFFIFEAALVPFEITACNVIINFWSDAVPTAAIIVIVIILYAIMNLFAVKWYGESEFWFALGKVLLIVGLIAFTFITMLGGNPQHDRFGFRFWQNPGSFAEYYTVGNLGRFMGFLQCFKQASFTIAGPDYVAMTAGEAENPRRVLPSAFKGVFYRLTAFFVLGSLCVGILVPYNSQELKDAFLNGLPGAAASPYVVAMNRLGISFLPSLVNAAVLTASFSAGNSYVYCASRSLYGLALERKAPQFLTRCTRQGVPVYCVFIVLLLSLSSFLQLGSGSQVVLSWFVSLVTASQLINYSVMAFTYIRFKKGCDAQGLDRNTLPYKGSLQPFSAWYALVGCFVMAFVGGYTVFLPGFWSVPNFLFSYMMIFIFPVLFVGWKLTHRTRWKRATEMDLRQDLAEIEQYEANFIPRQERGFKRVLDKLFG